MSAPQSSHAPAGSSAAGSSPRSAAALAYGQPFRRILVVSALLLLVVSTWLAYQRPLAPLPDQRPHFPSLAWWDTPVEFNAAARLPVIGGTIDLVTRSHDGRYVFVLGRPNLLWRYDRQTREWRELTPIPVPAPNASPASPTDPQKVADPKQPDVDVRQMDPKSDPKTDLQYPSLPLPTDKSTPPNSPAPREGKGAKGAQWSPHPTRSARPLLLLAMLGAGGTFEEAPVRDSGGGGVEGRIQAVAAAIGRESANRSGRLSDELGFANAKYGFAVSGGKVFYTDDGAGTWREIDVSAALLPGSHAMDIATEGFLLFSNGASVRPWSPDGSTTLESLPGSRGTLTAMQHGWITRLAANNDLEWLRPAPTATVHRSDLLRTLSKSEQEELLATDIGPDEALYALTLADVGERTVLRLHVDWEKSASAADAPNPFPAPSERCQLLVPAADDLWLLADSKGLSPKVSPLVRSLDGGRSWSAATRWKSDPTPGQHVRLPPPWYFVMLVPIGALLLLAWRLPPPTQRPGIADRLASDKPIEAGEPDYLGFERVALGLSAYLRNRATTPPLTVAITGPWGGGKSSLMNLLRADLEKWGHKPVWFNAWHHETEEHLLAALLEAVRGQAIPGWLQRGGIGYRVRLLWQRGRRRVVGLSVLLILFAGSLGYLVARPEQIGAVQALITKQVTQFKAVRDLFGVDETKTAGEAKAEATEKTPAHTGADAPTSAGATDAASKAESKSAAENIAPPVQKGARPAAFALVLSLLGVIASLWKGLQAFGVEPARLLASKSQRATSADLQAQTSFRHQFQQQFRDVTAALRPQTMAIFIDDLDRCQPEHAYKVLESVNFLMTSGDCFIVLGLERARIERGIGIQFKELAEEEPKHPGDPTDETAPQRFARRYLEKLINLEVAVPAATPAQLTALLTDRVAQAADGVAGELRPKRRWPAPDLTTVWMLLVPMLAVLTFMFSTSVFLAPPRATNTVATPANPAGEKRDLAPGQPDGAKAGGDTGKKSDASAGAVDLGPASFEAGQLGPQHFWIALLLGIGVGALGVWRLSIPPGAQTVDSEETAAAMNQVCPLLVAVPGITPRRIKQFINRVRYFSMMRGSYTAAPSWWTEQFTAFGTLLRDLFSKRRRKPAPVANAAADAKAGQDASRSSDSKSEGSAAATTTLDDTKLVVLGALFEMAPSKFGEKTEIHQIQDLVVGGPNEKDPVPASVRDLVLSLSADDLRAFNALRHGVRLAEDKAEASEGNATKDASPAE